MSETVQASKACPMCGESILAVAIKCRHCGSVLNEDAASALRKPPEIVGMILVLIPFVAAIVMYLWITHLTILDRPLDVMGGIVGAVILATILLIGVDASMIRSAKGNGPQVASVVIVAMLLWVIGYPAYLYQRSKFGAKNLIAGGLLAMLSLGAVYGFLYFVIDAQISAAQQLQQ